MTALDHGQAIVTAMKVITEKLDLVQSLLIG
jgi:hypothetical protein